MIRAILKNASKFIDWRAVEQQSASEVLLLPLNNAQGRGSLYFFLFGFHSAPCWLFLGPAVTDAAITVAKLTDTIAAGSIPGAPKVFEASGLPKILVTVPDAH